MVESFRVEVPASTSNLGSGFDTVSAALSLYLRVEAEPAAEPGIEWVSGWDGSEENILDKALMATLAALGAGRKGVRLRMENPIPLKRGLGSSGAAIVAGIKIAERLAGASLTTAEILGIAYPLEGHPDNLAASLLGGWALSRLGPDGVKVERITARLRCRFVVAIPEKTVSTAEAREILPKSYPLADAVFNLQRCALLVHALHEGRKELLGEAVQDALHQPYRARLAPGTADLLAARGLPANLRESLLGVTISGSGSTILALVDGHEEAVGHWMVERLAEAGSMARFRILDLAEKGVSVE